MWVQLKGVVPNTFFTSLGDSNIEKHLVLPLSGLALTLVVITMRSQIYSARSIADVSGVVKKKMQ